MSDAATVTITQAEYDNMRAELEQLREVQRASGVKMVIFDDVSPNRAVVMREIAVERSIRRPEYVWLAVNYGDLCEASVLLSRGKVQELALGLQRIVDEMDRAFAGKKAPSNG